MIAPNPHHRPAAPSSLALVCRMAERAAAKAMTVRPVRPRVEWRGLAYLRCLACKAWKVDEDFHKSNGGDNRASRCKVCTRKYDALRALAMSRERAAVEELARRFERKYLRFLRLKNSMARKPAQPVQYSPKVVNPTVVTPLPSSKRPAHRPSERQVEYVPDAAPLDPAAVGIPTVLPADDDGGNPDRVGFDALAFVEADRRARYERARAYNPALTWEQFNKPETRGRKPRLDSGAAKGVHLG